MSAQEFDVIVHPLDDGSYWAEVDGLPGCLTQASSYTDILAHLRDAHETCLAAPAPALSAATSAKRLIKEKPSLWAAVQTLRRLRARRRNIDSQAAT